VVRLFSSGVKVEPPPLRTWNTEPAPESTILAASVTTGEPLIDTVAPPPVENAPQVPPVSVPPELLSVVAADAYVTALAVQSQDRSLVVHRALVDDKAARTAAFEHAARLVDECCADREVGRRLKE